MPKQSAGLLMYRIQGAALQVLLVHPGGPFWAKKDEGVWSIPKGALDGAEDPQAAARREFEEETGLDAPGPFIDLGQITQKSGKIVHCWAFRGDREPTNVGGGLVRMEWPRGSGRFVEFQEVDRAEYFP